jgi:uncharacterized protein (DUF111 family)
VDVKVSEGDGLPITVKPEDDSVRALAQARNVSVKEVHAAALVAFWGTHGAPARGT